VLGGVDGNMHFSISVNQQAQSNFQFCLVGLSLGIFLFLSILEN
jgi:hypothetical protein